MNINSFKIIVIFIFFICSCGKSNVSSDKLNIEIGEKIYAKKNKLKKTVGVYINAGTFEHAYEIKKNGISYFFTTSNNVIEYIQIRSPKFKTPEGLMINDHVLKCLTYSTKKIVVEPGICYYVCLESGWKARIADINVKIDDLENKGRVEYFFKKIDYDSEMSLGDWKHHIDSVIIVGDDVVSNLAPQQ